MAAIEYDPVKNDENQRKHGLPLELAELLFHGSFIEEIDGRYDYGRPASWRPARSPLLAIASSS